MKPSGAIKAQEVSEPGDTGSTDGRTNGQAGGWPESAGMRLCGLWLLLPIVLSCRLLGLPGAGRGAGPEGAARWGREMQLEFGSILKLARKVLAETKIVTRRFVSERLGGAKLLFLTLPQHLPPISLSAQQWLALPAMQRLQDTRRALAVFRGYVELLGRREQERGDPSLAQGLQEIGLDLRDLTHHLNYQLRDHEAAPTAPPRALLRASAWSCLRETYLLLRAMETFLGRLVRDLTLLRLGALH